MRFLTLEQVLDFIAYFDDGRVYQRVVLDPLEGNSSEIPTRAALQEALKHGPSVATEPTLPPDVKQL